MNSVRKKWTSLDKINSDIKYSDEYIKKLINNKTRKIEDIIKQIPGANTSKDFFNITCLLSSEFESLSSDEIRNIFSQTNLYILVLNSIFRNNSFISSLSSLFFNKKSIKELVKDNEFLEKFTLINTAISLAFFGISLNHEAINNNSIEFLRKNIIDNFRHLLKDIGSSEMDLVKLFKFLERVITDKKLHYSINYKSTFPVRLSDDFLFENLKTSMTFAAVIFTSLMIQPSIEIYLRNIMIRFDDPKFSITNCLDKLFLLVNDLDQKIVSFHENSPKDLRIFFNVFITKNEKNIIYCISNFCRGFHYQGKDKRFYEVILEKLNYIDSLKKDFSAYIKSNFLAFNNEIIEENHNNDEWTNKLFLLSIKTFSVLEEVKTAKDSKWVVKVAVYELRQWLIEINEILNKHYIKDDWEKIEDYCKSENSEIEWKSTFYTPTENKFINDESSKQNSQRVFDVIVKTILAMINTKGGILLVGLVESPEKIIDEGVKNNLIVKNNITFFDIYAELKKLGKNLDQVKMQLLEKLNLYTACSVDEFNGLFDFESINLKNNDRLVTIIKISIQPSEKKFFLKKNEEGIKWISLYRRAEGQTISVDPNEFINRLNGNYKSDQM